jgi:hypothetical protein
MQINTSEVSVKNKENENIKIRQVTESIRFYVDNPSSKPSPIATQRSENKDQPKNDNKNSTEGGSDFKIKLLELIIKEIYNKEFDKIYSNLNKSNNNIPNNVIDDPKWKIQYDKREILQQNIEKQLNSNGVINTSDGKQVNFNIFLQLEFNNNYSGLSKTDLDYKDGFRINYNVPSELLNFENFEFELSKLDIPSKYPFINGGKGILTFDNNQDLLSKSNINLQSSNETLNLTNFADLEIPPNSYVRLNNDNVNFVSNINADNLYKRNNSPSKNILDLSF